ncbi:MAG: lamin tail domain-containing protein, partial [Candidatus Moranbacteria bacterium]|nr:lamin tail domain-containing protein [Candidatus Moranbacteria bacterium]
MNTLKKQNWMPLLCAMFLWATSFQFSEAMFQDIETISASDIGASAGSLDMVIDTNVSGYNGVFALPDTSPANNFKTSFEIQNEGTMNFQYNSKFVKKDGSDLLCETLRMKVKLNNETVFNGNLSDFSYQKNFLSPIDSDEWEFSVVVPESLNKKLEGLSCEFDILFTAWQTNFALPSHGWVDEEEFSPNIITMGQWENDSIEKGIVVLNEFMPDPAQGNEWVELYNNGSHPVDVSHWFVTDEMGPDSHTRTIDADHTNTEDTIIEPKGWLVIQNYDSFYLNNDGDTIKLFNAQGELMDSYTFGEKEISRGKTIARDPDGTGEWKDPIPTPGKKNDPSNDPEKMLEYYKSRCFKKNKEFVCDAAFMKSIGLMPEPQKVIEHETSSMEHETQNIEHETHSMEHEIRSMEHEESKKTKEPPLLCHPELDSGSPTTSTDEVMGQETQEIIEHETQDIEHEIQSIEHETHNIEQEEGESEKEKKP